MKKFKLTSEEKEVVTKLKNDRIPGVFKDIYVDHLLTVEAAVMFVADDLLKGKSITYECGTPEDFAELQKAIEVDKLDKPSREFYLGLVKVFEIFKKYVDPK